MMQDASKTKITTLVICQDLPISTHEIFQDLIFEQIYLESFPQKFPLTFGKSIIIIPIVCIFK